jgi:hypothetical protein
MAIMSTSKRCLSENAMSCVITLFLSEFAFHHLGFEDEAAFVHHQFAFL